MRATIIPVDGVVVVDGEGYGGLDLSFMDATINAIQWYGEDGEIERKDERGKMIANEPITDISPYQPAFDAWSEAKQKHQKEIDAAIAAQEAAQANANQVFPESL